jgi:hypothetical protein
MEKTPLEVVQKPLMVSLSNHSGILALPFDKLRASGDKMFFIIAKRPPSTIIFRTADVI